jgi:hypothetical protein
VRAAVVSVLVSAVILAAPLFGCKASVEGGVNSGAKDDLDKPLDKPMSAEQVSSSADTVKDPALFGERQDLSLRAATATCKCLGVALGQPGDAAFHWEGERPRTTRDAQLVFAMSSAGVACPEAGENAPGASYWGYEVVGNDVVVVVERAFSGRPVASGAIIPRPTGQGQVYVRPADKKLPYGRPMTGSGGRCQIGKLVGVTPSVTPNNTAPSRGDEPSQFSAESALP